MKLHEGWINKRFDEVFDLQMGRTPSRDNKVYWTDGQFKWISIADLKNQKYITSTKECITELAISESGIKPIPANTVIMSFKLSIGKTAITKESIFSNEAIMAFNLKNGYKIVPEYFYHYLNSYDWGTMNRAVMGHTLNKATISAKRIFIPPIPIQHQIVSELDTLSDIITKKKQQLADIDILAQATFYDMFGDPVSNEKGWEVKKLGNLGNFKNGLNYKNSETGNNIKILSVSNFKSNIILRNLEQLGYVVLDNEPNEDYYLKEKDIVFVRSNGSKELVGRCLLMGPILEKITFSGFCIRFRMESKEVIPQFLIYILTNEHFKSNLIDQGRGANINNVNQQMLAGKVIILPPISIQDNFIRKIESIEKQKQLINQSIAGVQQLFDYTMDKYFN
jgi:type I restriction enzyme S subunit